MDGSGNKEKDKKEPVFPEGYEYLNELMTEGMQRRREIDKELEKISKNTSPQKPNTHRIHFRPPGVSGGGPSVNQVYTVQKLQEEKAQIESELNKRMNREIEMLEADEQMAAQIWETFNEKMHPNPYEGKSPQELKRLGKMEKDLQSSQDIMRMQLKLFRENPPKREKETPPQNEPDKKEEVLTKQENALDTSQEFMLQQLTYFREKEARKEKTIISISARFSQSLNYSKALEKGEQTPVTEKPKDDPSPSKE